MTRCSSHWRFSSSARASSRCRRPLPRVRGGLTQTESTGELDRERLAEAVGDRAAVRDDRGRRARGARRPAARGTAWSSTCSWTERDQQQRTRQRRARPASSATRPRNCAGVEFDLAVAPPHGATISTSSGCRKRHAQPSRRRPARRRRGSTRRSARAAAGPTRC